MELQLLITTATRLHLILVLKTFLLFSSVLSIIPQGDIIIPMYQVGEQKSRGEPQQAKEQAGTCLLICQTQKYTLVMVDVL